jgi:hypothetical protein
MCFEPFARSRVSFKLAEALKSASMSLFEVGSTCSYPVTHLKDAREQDERVVERLVVICDGVRSTSAPTMEALPLDHVRPRMEPRRHRRLWSLLAAHVIGSLSPL